MNLNLTLVGQAISFAIFVTFCMRNVWPPLIQALRERQEKIAIASKAMADLDREVVGARESLRKQVGSLAVDGARRILGGEVNEGSHSKVIDDLIKQI